MTDKGSCTCLHVTYDPIKEEGGLWGKVTPRWLCRDCGREFVRAGKAVRLLESLPTWGSYPWQEAAESVRLKLLEYAQQVVTLIHERDAAIAREEELLERVSDLEQSLDAETRHCQTLQSDWLQTEAHKKITQLQSLLAGEAKYLGHLAPDGAVFLCGDGLMPTGIRRMNLIRGWLAKWIVNYVESTASHRKEKER